MVRRPIIPGWTRLAQNEFKATITAAMEAEPALCQRLRHSIQITASRRGVPQGLRDRYLRWLTEVEAAIGAMAEAEQSKLTRESMPDSAPTAQSEAAR